MPFIGVILSKDSTVPDRLSTVAGLYILLYCDPMPQPPLPRQPFQGPARAIDMVNSSETAIITLIMPVLLIVASFEPVCKVMFDLTLMSASHCRFGSTQAQPCRGHRR